MFASESFKGSWIIVRKENNFLSRLLFFTSLLLPGYEALCTEKSSRIFTENEPGKLAVGLFSSQGTAETILGPGVDCSFKKDLNFLKAIETLNQYEKPGALDQMILDLDFPPEMIGEFESYVNKLEGSGIDPYKDLEKASSAISVFFEKEKPFLNDFIKAFRDLDIGNYYAVRIKNAPVGEIPPTPQDGGRPPFRLYEPNNPNAKTFHSEYFTLLCMAIANHARNEARESYKYKVQYNPLEKTGDPFHAIAPVDDPKYLFTISSLGSLIEFDDHTEDAHYLDDDNAEQRPARIFNLIGLRGDPKVKTGLVSYVSILQELKRRYPDQYEWFIYQMLQPNYIMSSGPSFGDHKIQNKLPFLYFKDGQLCFRGNFNPGRMTPEELNPNAKFVMETLWKIARDSSFRQKNSLDTVFEKGLAVYFRNDFLLHRREAFKLDPQNWRWLQRCYWVLDKIKEGCSQELKEQQPLLTEEDLSIDSTNATFSSASLQSQEQHLGEKENENTKIGQKIESLKRAGKAIVTEEEFESYQDNINDFLKKSDVQKLIDEGLKDEVANLVTKDEFNLLEKKVSNLKDEITNDVMKIIVEDEEWEIKELEHVLREYVRETIAQIEEKNQVIELIKEKQVIDLKDEITNNIMKIIVEAEEEDEEEGEEEGEKWQIKELEHVREKIAQIEEKNQVIKLIKEKQVIDLKDEITNDVMKDVMKIIVEDEEEDEEWQIKELKYVKERIDQIEKRIIESSFFESSFKSFLEMCAFFDDPHIDVPHIDVPHIDVPNKEMPDELLKCQNFIIISSNIENEISEFSSCKIEDDCVSSEGNYLACVNNIHKIRDRIDSFVSSKVRGNLFERQGTKACLNEDTLSSTRVQKIKKNDISKYPKEGKKRSGRFKKSQSKKSNSKTFSQRPLLNSFQKEEKTESIPMSSKLPSNDNGHAPHIHGATYE